MSLFFEILGFALFVFWLLLIVLGFHSFIAKPFYIPSEAMLPGLQVGDRLVVSKFAYGWSFVSPTIPDPVAIARDLVLHQPVESWSVQLPFIPGRVFGSLPERGDVVIVTKYDRLSRLLHDLLGIVARIQAAGAGFRSLAEDIDTTTPAGRLVFHVFASIAQFERERIAERTREGLAAARRRGRVGGRPPALSPEQRAEVRRLRDDDRRLYVNDTGCGNMLDLRHPRVLQMVMDSLRYWVQEMHVDGFRFDLAVALARGKDGAFDPDHPLLVAREEPSRTGVLVITSDRGLCGGYNANVLKEGERVSAALRDQGKEVQTYLVGRRAVSYYSFRKKEFVAEWTGSSEKPSFENAREIGERLVADFVKEYEEGGVDEVHVVYTRFVSMVTQEAEVIRLLPLEVVEGVEEPGADELYPLYEFEPSGEELLDTLLPRYVNARIFNCLLQAAASELAARQRAMKSATDNAEELIKKYTRLANQARQAEITQEISEIVGGAGALQADAQTRLKDTPDFPEQFRTEAQTFSDVLDLYRASEGLHWSMLAPAPMIAPGQRTGSYRTELDVPAGESISAEDFAVALVDEAESDAHAGRRFTVAN